LIEQGFEMGRPSLIELEADVAGGRITAVRVGGSSVLMSEGWIEAE
jgi:trans-2,3-dihydro-3-hydroxyanthranilate isomerase